MSHGTNLLLPFCLWKCECWHDCGNYSTFLSMVDQNHLDSFNWGLFLGVCLKYCNLKGFFLKNTEESLIMYAYWKSTAKCLLILTNVNCISHCTCEIYRTWTVAHKTVFKIILDWNNIKPYCINSLNSCLKDIQLVFVTINFKTAVAVIQCSFTFVAIFLVFEGKR